MFTMKCRQAYNMHNSTSPSKCRNTNFSNETAERILMSTVQLLMLYLAMTTQKELCKVRLLGFVFFFPFLFLCGPGFYKLPERGLLSTTLEHQLNVSQE